MKKTFKARVGPGFVAGGLGRDGPYVLGYGKVNRATGVKISYGTRGLEVQGDRRLGKRTRVSGGISSVSGPYGEIKYKRNKLRISAADIGRSRRGRSLARRLLRGYY
jgi:hypothetical protein